MEQKSHDSNQLHQNIHLMNPNPEQASQPFHQGSNQLQHMEQSQKLL